MAWIPPRNLLLEGLIDTLVKSAPNLVKTLGDDLGKMVDSLSKLGDDGIKALDNAAAGGATKEALKTAITTAAKVVSGPAAKTVSKTFTQKIGEILSRLGAKLQGKSVIATADDAAKLSAQGGKAAVTVLDDAGQKIAKEVAQGMDRVMDLWRAGDRKAAVELYKKLAPKVSRLPGKYLQLAARNNPVKSTAVAIDTIQASTSDERDSVILGALAKAIAAIGLTGAAIYIWSNQPGDEEIEIPGGVGGRDVGPGEKVDIESMGIDVTQEAIKSGVVGKISGKIIGIPGTSKGIASLKIPAGHVALFKVDPNGNVSWAMIGRSNASNMKLAGTATSDNSIMQPEPLYAYLRKEYKKQGSNLSEKDIKDRLTPAFQNLFSMVKAKFKSKK